MNSNKANYEKVIPILRKTFPKLFQLRKFHPLERGIHKVIIDKVTKLFHFISKTMIRKAIRYHCGLKGYLIAILKQEFRLNHDGSYGSNISEEEKQFARVKLKEIHNFPPSRRNNNISSKSSKNPKSVNVMVRKSRKIQQYDVNQLHRKTKYG